MWITINEPYIISRVHYGLWINMFQTKPGQDLYIAGHHLIKAHAEAYHLYTEKYKPTMKGAYNVDERCVPRR